MLIHLQAVLVLLVLVVEHLVVGVTTVVASASTELVVTVQHLLELMMMEKPVVAEKTAAKLIAREVPTIAQLAASDERFALAA